MGNYRKVMSALEAEKAAWRADSKVLQGVPTVPDMENMALRARNMAQKQLKNPQRRKILDTVSVNNSTVFLRPWKVLAKGPMFEEAVAAVGFHLWCYSQHNERGE